MSGFSGALPEEKSLTFRPRYRYFVTEAGGVPNVDPLFSSMRPFRLLSMRSFSTSARVSPGRI
jgi:hypothetical protein